MLIRTGAAMGAAVGASVAALMIVFDQVMPFSVSVNSFIDRAIFKVCPLYILGFSSAIPNKAIWFLVTILGNAVLYGLVFGGIVGILSLFKRSAAA